jgi:hypothetical protein
MWALNSSIGEPHVAAPRLDAQKLRGDQRVEDRLAHHTLNAAEPFHLCRRQTQPRHLQILRAQAVNHIEDCPHGKNILRNDDMTPRSMAPPQTVHVLRSQVPNRVRYFGMGGVEIMDTSETATTTTVRFRACPESARGSTRAG